MRKITQEEMIKELEGIIEEDYPYLKEELELENILPHLIIHDNKGIHREWTISNLSTFENDLDSLDLELHKAMRYDQGKMWTVIDTMDIHGYWIHGTNDFERGYHYFYDILFDQLFMERLDHGALQLLEDYLDFKEIWKDTKMNETVIEFGDCAFIYIG